MSELNPDAINEEKLCGIPQRTEQTLLTIKPKILLIMGKVVFEDPVHHISGKISKKYRTCYNYRKWSDRKYTSVHGDRTTPASTEELKLRAKFKVVRQAALQRSMDLSHLTYDQMDFIAERKAQGSAFKYTTYKGWLFGKGWQYFDESTNKVVWPERLTPVIGG